MNWNLHKYGWAARRVRRWFLLGGAGCLTFLAGGAQPRISYIQIPSHLPNYVLIHFDTEPNRDYILQYTQDFPPSPSSTWSNLYVVPESPQTGHYIYPDPRTQSRRFYRLCATP